MILQFCQLMYNVWRRVGLGGCTLYAVFYIRGYTLYFKYVYTIHYTLYIIHDTLCILNDDVRYIPYKRTTKNVMRYYVVCILYFVFQKMMFLYKVYEQNNKELVVFRVVKNKRKKNEDGITDVFLQSI